MFYNALLNVMHPSCVNTPLWGTPSPELAPKAVTPLYLFATWVCKLWHQFMKLTKCERKVLKNKTKNRNTRSHLELVNLKEKANNRRNKLIHLYQKLTWTTDTERPTGWCFKLNNLIGPGAWFISTTVHFVFSVKTPVVLLAPALRLNRHHM